MESPHAADPEGIDPQVVELATTIFALARAGDTASLDAYIRAGVPANLTNDQGDTLVMLAAYYGHADTVECLCRHGADVNRLNDRGQSPLAGAVFKDEDAGENPARPRRRPHPTALPPSTRPACSAKSTTWNCSTTPNPSAPTSARSG